MDIGFPICVIESASQQRHSNIAGSSSNPITRRVVYERQHALLQYLLSLIPTLPSTLQPFLIKYFPHRRQPKAAQITYIRNLLRIIEYCQSLSERILSTIIERVIQIDVSLIYYDLEENSSCNPFVG